LKILIILPNWLGDAVMATPALELLSKSYTHVRFTFLGSFASIEALKHHPLCDKSIIDTTKDSKYGRLKATLMLADELGSFDIAITLRKQFHSSLLLWRLNAKTKIARKSWHSKLFQLTQTPVVSNKVHLVLQYCHLVTNNAYPIKTEEIDPLKLYIVTKTLPNPTLGINAGATYGSAKRWYPERFAEVGAYFSNQYDILIFGGPNEIEVAKEIEEELKKRGVKNYQNIAGKTTIHALCEYIGGCAIFVTNDSGPMHIAAAYQVPTVAIFGPTKHEETSQWKNHKSIIIKEDLKCSPCMKRECPLKYHECMQKITASQVIEAIKLLH